MITTNYSIQSQEYHPTPAPEGPEGSIWIYMKISMPKWNHCNQASTDTGPVSLPPLKATVDLKWIKKNGTSCSFSRWFLFRCDLASILNSHKGRVDCLTQLIALRSDFPVKEAVIPRMRYQTWWLCSCHIWCFWNRCQKFNRCSLTCLTNEKKCQPESLQTQLQNCLQCCSNQDMFSAFLDFLIGPLKTFLGLSYRSG